MNQQKNMILKTIWLFVLYSFMSPVWSIGYDRPIPIQLSLEDAHALSKLISYPEPKLKNRQWVTGGYVENGKRTRAFIDVESDYYEQGKNYKRYYKIPCHTNFEDAKHWKCGKANDVIEIKDNIDKPPILLEDRLSSKEVLRVFDFLKQSVLFSRYGLPIYSLKKWKNTYVVRMGDFHTIAGMVVVQTKHGDFLATQGSGILMRD